MSEVALVELKKIKPNRLNPRLEINIEKLNELSESIKQKGLLQPIIVRPKDSFYEVVVGERRYRASQQVGLDKIPVVIKDFTDEEVIELNLIENIQRDDLTAVEKAKSCKMLLEQYPKKYPDKRVLASSIGVSEKTLSDWMKTLDLPEEIQRYIAPKETYSVPKGKVDYSTALQVTRKIKNPEMQKELVKEIAEKKLPRNVTEKVIEEVSKTPSRPVQTVLQEVMEEPPELQFRLKHLQPILDGTKKQTSRKGIEPKIREGGYAYVTIWEPKVAKIKISKIERKRLSDFTEEDARREGGYTLEEFKKVWEEIHGKGSWEPDLVVSVIHFDLLKTSKG